MFWEVSDEENIGWRVDVGFFVGEEFVECCFFVFSEVFVIVGFDIYKVF